MSKHEQAAMAVIDSAQQQGQSLHDAFIEQLTLNQPQLNEGQYAFFIFALFDMLIRSEPSQTQERP